MREFARFRRCSSRLRDAGRLSMAEKGSSSWFVVGERGYANVMLIVRGSRTGAGEAAATISRNEIAGHFYRGAEAGSCDRARDIGASRTARARARRTRKRAAGQDPSSALSWRPREDSNLRTRLRRPMLYPLSYEGGGWRIPGRKLKGRAESAGALGFRRFV